MVQHLLPEVGFGWTMRICAFLILALLAFAILAVSSGVKHAPRPFNIADYVQPLRESNFLIISVASFFLYCKTLSPQLWPGGETDCVNSGGMFVPFDYIVLNATHYGMSTHMAFCLVPIMNGARYV